MKRSNVTKRANELCVVITGPACSGRTTLASIVAASLREAGATVTVDDGGDAERFGPLTGKKIQIQVRLAVRHGATALRLVK